MMRMLYPIGFYRNYFSIFFFNGETHLVNTVALFYLLKDTRIPFGKNGGLVKTPFNALKKSLEIILDEKVGIRETNMNATKIK